MCLEEKTDCKPNSIVNILVRVLDPSKPTAALLLASKRLEKCTAKTIMTVVRETFQKFEVSTSQILMFVSDGAATMLSVSRCLEESRVSFFCT